LTFHPSTAEHLDLNTHTETQSAEATDTETKQTPHSNQTDATDETDETKKKNDQLQKFNIQLAFNNSLTNSGKIVNLSFFIKFFLFKRLTQILPIFSYFIYSVDKNIRKFSRGKSGKYTFV
jgi:hypothetical protein